MKQQQSTSNKSSKTTVSQVREEFNQVKAEKIEKPQVKTIRVFTKSCCGCGCSYDWYNVEMAVDSPYNDGDEISLKQFDKHVKRFESISTPKDL